MNRNADVINSELNQLNVSSGFKHRSTSVWRSDNHQMLFTEVTPGGGLRAESRLFN